MGAREVMDRIGRLVPGYKGYVERELRRATDRALRDAIVSRLGVVRARVAEQTARQAREMRFDGLEALEHARRRLDVLIDKVRHAPEGYSGFFDAVRIDAGALDALTSHDAATCDAVETLSGATLGAPDFEGALAQLEERVRERAERLRGGVNDHA